MSHSALAMQWEANGDIRDKARKLSLATCPKPKSYLMKDVELMSSSICIVFGHYATIVSYRIEVEVPTEVIDRDTIKLNVKVLTLAAQALGLRVGVRLCTVHVQALYDYMQISCPRNLSYVADLVDWSSTQH